MTTKLKIDLSQGILEVEGSEAFVRAIYKEFKAQFLGEDEDEQKAKPTRRRRKTTATKAEAKPAPAPKKAKEPAKPTPSNATPEPAAKRPPPAPTPVYNYVKDLDLGPSNDHPSLVDFMDHKFPITNEERNLVFSYYLQHTISHKPITPDDIYTCYRKANIRAPLNLENSLRMTADHQNWIKIDKQGQMTVTTAGKRYVEKQLPKKTKV